MHWVTDMNLRQVHTLTRRVALPIALLVLGACGDAAAPLDQQGPGRPSLEFAPGSNGTFAWPTSTWRRPAATGITTLRQSPTAPPLETYQLSFVASRWKASSVTVNY